MPRPWKENEEEFEWQSRKDKKVKNNEIEKEAKNTKCIATKEQIDNLYLLTTKGKPSETNETSEHLNNYGGILKF